MGVGWIGADANCGVSLAAAQPACGGNPASKLALHHPSDSGAQKRSGSVECRDVE